MSTDLRVQFVQAPAGIRLAQPVARRHGGSGRDARKPTERGDAQTPGDAPSKERDEAARAPDPRSSDDTTDVVAGAERAAEPGESQSADPGDAALDAPVLSPDPALAEAQAVPPEWMHLQNRFLELISELERQAESRRNDMEAEFKNLTPTVVDLALAIASRVLNTELDAGRVDVAPMIDEALAKVLSGVDEEAPVRARVGAEIEDVARSVLGARLGDGERFHLMVDRALPERAIELQCDMRRVTVDAKQALSRLSDHLRGGLDV